MFSRKSGYKNRPGGGHEKPSSHVREAEFSIWFLTVWISALKPHTIFNHQTCQKCHWKLHQLCTDFLLFPPKCRSICFWGPCNWWVARVPPRSTRSFSTPWIPPIRRQKGRFVWWNTAVVLHLEITWDDKWELFQFDPFLDWNHPSSLTPKTCCTPRKQRFIVCFTHHFTIPHNKKLPKKWF